MQLTVYDVDDLRRTNSMTATIDVQTLDVIRSPQPQSPAPPVTNLGLSARFQGIIRCSSV